MLFDVFSHSFFNPEEDMSAAELLMMFHYYFVGNTEGLLFDVAGAAVLARVLGPLGRYLEAHGAEVRLGAPVQRISPGRGARFCVELTDGSLLADAVVLAVTVPALQRLVADSPALDHLGFRAGVDSLAVTRPFAVWRLWLESPDGPLPGAFAGTTGLGLLDNISLYHLLEDESRAWAARHGGAVVELHAYAIPPATAPAEVKRQLMAGLRALYPEAGAAGVVHERFLWHDDCPAFRPGSHSARPEVVSPLAGVTLAGDFVRLPLPSALMERAATSGMMAANHLLAPFGVGAEPIESLPARGLLSRASSGGSAMKPLLPRPWTLGRAPSSPQRVTSPGPDWAECKPRLIAHHVARTQGLAVGRLVRRRRRPGHRRRPALLPHPGPGVGRVAWPGRLPGGPQRLPPSRRLARGGPRRGGQDRLSLARLSLGDEPHGGFRPLPTHHDGVLVWVRLDDGEAPTPAPILPARPERYLDAVIRREARCESRGRDRQPPRPVARGPPAPVRVQPRARPRSDGRRDHRARGPTAWPGGSASRSTRGSTAPSRGPS